MPKPKEKIYLKRDDNSIIVNEEQITKEMTSFFESFFNTGNISKLMEIKPNEMKIPFTETEVELAIKTLKNNKSSGSDNLTAEQLKHGPQILNKTHCHNV